MRIGIYGYGNLGKGVEEAVKENPDVDLLYIFSNRPYIKVSSTAEVVDAKNVLSYKDKIDVLVICAGSQTTLPSLTPELAKHFNVVDSFDTHALITKHFDNVEKSALDSCHTALISAGWDPGLFSVNRVCADAVLPNGKDYTFWGPGVSQGHSEAIRGITGVIDARQYTVPVDETLAEVRSGSVKDYTAREKHKRICYVAVEDGADKKAIESDIVNMPNYFADYDTTVNFVSPEELHEKHSGLPHGGFVVRSGKTGNMTQTIEYSLKLQSNPLFTGSALVAFARAVYKKYCKKEYGCYTALDCSPAELSGKTPEELRKHML